MRANEPSERNYVIFCAVEFEMRSLRKVAVDHGISLGRVQQIVKQTRAWFVENAPKWINEVPGEVRPIIAREVYNERLAHLRREATDAWEDSATARRGAPAKTRVKELPYLHTAARLSRQEFDGELRLAAWQLAHKDSPATPPGQPAKPYARGVENVEIPEENAEPTPYARDEAAEAEQPAVAEEVVEQAVAVEQEEIDESEVVSLTSEDEHPPTVALPLNPPLSGARERKERRRRERKLRKAQARQRGGA